MKCGHECIGFCGEPCPPKCLTCNKKELTEIFFGTEDEPNARFVYLEDCHHVLESSGLDGWMESQCSTQQQEDSASKAIELPVCPKCKTPMRRNLRYSNYVKRQLFSIEQVKFKMNGTEKEIQSKKQEFIDLMNTEAAAHDDSKIATDIIKEANFKANLTISAYYSLQNKWNLYKKLKEIEAVCRTNNEKKLPEDFVCLKYEFEKMRNILINSKCVDWQNAKQNRLTNERIDQLSLELQRISQMEKYFCCKFNITENMNKKNDPEVTRLLASLNAHLILSTKPYCEIETNVKSCFDKLNYHLTGLRISNEERSMILKAMNLNQGHWYKCRNGHVYCITECGGANARERLSGLWIENRYEKIIYH